MARGLAINPAASDDLFVPFLTSALTIVVDDGGGIAEASSKTLGTGVVESVGEPLSTGVLTAVSAGILVDVAECIVEGSFFTTGAGSTSMDCGSVFVGNCARNRLLRRILTIKFFVCAGFFGRAVMGDDLADGEAFDAAMIEMVGVGMYTGDVLM